MKHRRGIDLATTIQPERHHDYVAATGVYETISSLREWEVLGARCGKCGRTGWLDKSQVLRRYGNQYLSNVGSRMVCLCGNRKGNKVLVGTLSRN